MALRITSWNVNGIRNPFGYQPWRDKKTFEAMFDTLEADIVVLQETKIQRKDLRDDMVLVPGWDCYFSLPKYKKGYSGVAIYTRQSICAPIRAEEGVTGVLQPPNSSLAYRDLPKEQQIGGYPIPDQLNQSVIDPATLDSEGRCVILEFPAFVLIGTYCPANRDESRDDFRLGFLNALDARVRNLAREGKRVILTGDLNISREEIDTANAEEQMRKHGLTGSEFVSTPSRRLFNQLLVDGKVFGERDQGREEPVLWDLCRGFHPGRRGMFTCWEQRINARPGNFGSRIDYVLCSAEIKDWFGDANIQEGLLGSDHCPVYANIKDRVRWDDGKEVDIKDIMNPPGTFHEGKRSKPYSTKDIPALSGKLIPEFGRRQNIREMFSKKPTSSTPTTETTVAGHDTITKSSSEATTTAAVVAALLPWAEMIPNPASAVGSASAPTSRPRSESASLVESAASASEQGNGSNTKNNVTNATGRKRAIDDLYSTRPLKRSKSGTATANGSTTTNSNGLKKIKKQSLKGFFTPKCSADTNGGKGNEGITSIGATNPIAPLPQTPPPATSSSSANKSFTTSPLSQPRRKQSQQSPSIPNVSQTSSTIPNHNASPSTSTTTKTTTQNEASNNDDEKEEIIDPIVSKESWSRIFTKPPPPKCEGHNEPCLSLTTKRAGINRGRAFWMCARPIGPSGAKESGTKWRCATFIWGSDWSGG
ncbi:MAG: hypothetical protein M1823_002542 [Watsoniomyces obsoletus]|nr:MAG: hypothetical protein M1823_002542 [Watsoniomyces obsoletus]